MKRFYQIIALLLAFAFTNVIVGKTIHEITEHHHEEEACKTEGADHFHEFEFAHPDLICDFNFSTSLEAQNSTSTEAVLLNSSNKKTFYYNLFNKSVFFNNLSLRGPPETV